MNYLVYKITNNVNGKIYIGAHKTIEINDGYMGSGVAIRNAIKKYGIENFTKEILYDTNNVEEMFNMESELVNEDFVNRNDTYNIREGGNGGFYHINSLPKEERVNLLKIAKMKENNEIHWGGTTNYKDDTREKVLVGAIKGNETRCKNAQTPEAKQKRKETFNRIKHAQGSKNSQFGTHVYCDKNNNRKRYKEGEQPKGWITTTELKEQKMKKSKRWYNNGIRNYYLVMPNLLVEELGLVKGRINSVKAD